MHGPQIGPRMSLEIVKVEEGMCDGKVLYHAFEQRSAAQVAGQDAAAAAAQQAAAEKEARRKQQVCFCHPLLCCCWNTAFPPKSEVCR